MKFISRPTFIWFVLPLFLFMVLPALFFLGMDRWGASLWADCQRDLAERGEILDLRTLAPPGRPEDDLSQAPIFAPLYSQPEDFTAPIQKVAIDLHAAYSADYPKGNDYLRGQPFDLTAWQKFYFSIPAAHLTKTGQTPAQDVLQVLSRFDPQMKEVDAALSNPNAYWPIDYDRPFDMRMTAIVDMISLAKLLSLRGHAHLANGETELAEKDYLFSLRLTRPLEKQGRVIDLLVLLGVRAIDDSVLWDGLQRHAWNDTQLREIEAALASSDDLATAARCFRLERASTLQTITYTQKHDVGALLGGGLYSLLRLRPAGWWDLDRREYSLRMQDIVDCFHTSSATVTPLKPTPPDPNLFVKGLRVVVLPLSAVVLGSIGNGVEKAAHGETYLRLARLACRLEEYRLAHGHYPDALADLPDLPPHLNQEVMDTAPLRYQKKGEGYLLYSIGWDGKDDGGVMMTDQTEGDWPWPDPAAQK